MNPSRLHIPGVPGATQTHPVSAPGPGALLSTTSPAFQVPLPGAVVPSVTPARCTFEIPAVRFSNATGNVAYPVTSAFCQRQPEKVTLSPGSFLNARALFPSYGVSTE